MESNIHHPTDSTLLGDGVRVLIRTMKKIADRRRDRNQAARPQPDRLLDTTSPVVGQAKRFSTEISEGVKRSADVLQQITLEGLREELDRMLLLVRRVMRQTRARIFHGDTRRFSAYSSRRPRSSARARPASPTSSAR